MPTPKEQILFLCILSGPGQLHAFEDLSLLNERIGDLASTGFHPATKLAYQRHVFKKPRFWTAVSIQERTARQ